MEFGRLCACNRARFRDGFVRVVATPRALRSRNARPASVRLNRFCRAFEQKETKLIFKIANLAA